MDNYDIETCILFKQAEKYKNKLKSEYVGTEHLILAILDSDDSINEILNKYNLNYHLFYNELNNLLPKCNKKTPDIYTPLLKKIIINCQNDNDLSPKNLFYNILKEGEGVAIRILLGLDIEIDNLYNELKNSNNSIKISLEYGKLLNDYICLNEKVIGREKEINLMIETLLRKKKNNPVLIGEAGVGKSAIVEELCRRIINKEVPDKLLNKKIVMLEMGNLVSGTRYRGEFEERLMNIINEVQNNKDIILFIDEIHSMSGAGAAEGAISAADILKPYLARGDIKCIGATTNKEYEKYIIPDKALMRRFETIYIKEPNKEETYNILKNIKAEYINFHKVNISDQNLKILIDLVDIYFPNKKNPDKSVELLDSLLSYVKLKNSNNLIRNKEEELKKITIIKCQEYENGNYKNALKTTIKENNLKKQINLLRNSRCLTVKKEDILEILEYKNNLILNKKTFSLKGYSKKFELLIKNQTHNITFLLNNLDNTFINTLKEKLKYEIFNLTSQNINKLFEKVKYNPSLIIVSKEDSYEVKNLLKKIRNDSILEYNDEYISFNNTISIIVNKISSFGFNKYDSDIIIDYKLNNDKKVKLIET